MEKRGARPPQTLDHGRSRHHTDAFRTCYLPIAAGLICPFSGADRAPESSLEDPEVYSVKSILSGIALAATLLTPVAASAAEGFATANVNMRSGPSTRYPAVVVIPVGAPIEIHGCLADANWCDVSFARGRGWVSGTYVQAEYQSNRVYVAPRYYRPLGIPTVTFELGNYWDRNYRNRDFYRDREYWRGGQGRYDRDRDRDRDRNRDQVERERDRVERDRFRIEQDRNQIERDRNRDRDRERFERQRERDRQRFDDNNNGASDRDRDRDRDRRRFDRDGDGNRDRPQFERRDNDRRDNERRDNDRRDNDRRDNDRRDNQRQENQRQDNDRRDNDRQNMERRDNDRRGTNGLNEDRRNDRRERRACDVNDPSCVL